MDLKTLDPDWQFAANHAKASCVAKEIPLEFRTQQHRLCPCCYQVIDKQQIPYCQNIKQLTFLGFGLPLFYKFFRMCIILILVSTLSYNILSLYWAITHNYQFCLEHTSENTRLLAGEGSSEPKCWTFMVRFSRLEGKVTVEQQITRIISWVIQFIFLIYMRFQIMKLAEYYDERTTSPSDYSIIIKQLGYQKGLKTKLKKFFENFFDKQYKIQQYTFLAEYPIFQSLRKQQADINEQMKLFYRLQDTNNEEFEKLSEQLNQIKQKIKQQAFRQSQLAEKDELECQKVILSFENESVKQEILEKFKEGKKKRQKLLIKFFGEKAGEITISEAPEPQEIIWENIHEKKQKRFIRKIISWTCMVLMLVILTVAIYYILHAKTKLIISSLETAEGNPSALNGAIALVYITILLILFFNKFVMAFIFHKLTDMELLESGFKYQKSFGTKYFLGLFFTTAFMTLIVEGIQQKNFNTYIYGLIDQETLMFFSNVTFIPIFWFINPFYQFKRFKRYLKYGRKDMTQAEANLLMEDSPYDIGKRYAEIIEIVWFTLLYATLIPFGGFLTTLGLFIYYWIDKYNLLRRSVLKFNISYKLALHFLMVLEWSIVFEPTGALIFDGLLRQLDGLNISTSIVMLVLSVVYVLIPKTKIVNLIRNQKFELESKPFNEAKKKFRNTYHSLHPIMKILNHSKSQKQIYKNKQIQENAGNNTESAFNGDDKIQL